MAFILPELTKSVTMERGHLVLQLLEGVVLNEAVSLGLQEGEVVAGYQI